PHHLAGIGLRAAGDPFRPQAGRRMSLLQHPSRLRPSGTMQPPSAPQKKEDPILAVGRLAVVTCRSEKSDRGTLTDENGTAALAPVADGVEVEILAWRPRRGGGTRYRVVPTKGGVEGWVGAASLKAREIPPPPRVAAAARPPEPAAAKTKTAARPAR